MSKVTEDISTLVPDLFGESAIYLKNNWENIYIFVWVFTITIIVINVLKVDMNTNGKEAVFKNLAVYEQFTSTCEDAGKNCPKKPGKKSCTFNDCCVWATSKKGSSCVQGDKEGPEEDNDAKGSKYDEFWFLKKRYNI
jgi:hypothetical protein